MFTNGMTESNSSDIYLRDVSAEAFLAMLQFMYSGELEMKDRNEINTLLLEILLLADRFGVTYLLQECCKLLLECISEVIHHSVLFLSSLWPLSNRLCVTSLRNHILFLLFLPKILQPAWRKRKDREVTVLLHFGGPVYKQSANVLMVLKFARQHQPPECNQIFWSFTGKRFLADPQEIKS